MGLNLRDYEYELPNTIFGTLAYWNSGDASDNAGYVYEIIIIPQGRTYRIDHLRIIGGPAATLSTFSVAIARSVSPTQWGYTQAHSSSSAYSTPSESDSVPWSRLASGGGDEENVNYDQWGPTPRYDLQKGGRLWHYLARNDLSSSAYQAENGSRPESGFDVITPQRGPIWMQSGDSLLGWQNGNPGTSNGSQGRNHRGSYIMSYMEFF